MPENIPSMKKPKGKPIRNIPPATGRRVYNKISTIAQAANRIKPRRRPMASVSQALTRYPASEPLITINK